MIDRELVLRKLDAVGHHVARLRAKIPVRVDVLSCTIVHESIGVGIGDFIAFVKAVRAFIDSGDIAGRTSQ
ncbi:MAG: hypothetical protein EXR27_07590 [Betaproteobacteria bacterium]|nr:hypothetical protein [Betaproteobacteria bacterium]